MVRYLIQIIACFLPPPLNVWCLRVSSAKIGRRVVIQPGVLLLAKRIEIGSDVKIRFGTIMNARRVRFGDKTLIGYFVHVKGASDLTVGPACVIGPRTMINCDYPVTLGHYSGVGPGCTLFTHGSFLPASEGYRTSFGSIEIRDKAWVTMRSVVGPGVTVGEGTRVMPGTVLLESVGMHRLVSGDPAKLINIPAFRGAVDLEELAQEILAGFAFWLTEQENRRYLVSEGALNIPSRKGVVRITVNEKGDITVLTRKGEKSDGMFFNLADLSTDALRHPVKSTFEGYMRLYHGLTFL